MTDIRKNEQIRNYRDNRVWTMSLSQVCFAVLFFIFMVEKIYVVSQSAIVMYALNFIEWPFYLLSFVNALINAKYKLRECIFILLVCFVFGATYVASGYAELLKGALLVVAMSRSEFQKTIAIMYHVLIITAIITITLYLCRISDAGIRRRGAVTLGYINANDVGFVCMMLVVLTVARKEIIPLREKLALALVVGIGYAVSSSRSGCWLALVVLLFSNRGFYRRMKESKLVRLVVPILPCICFAISVITAVAYSSNRMIQLLNGLMSSRIWLNSYVISSNPIPLLGQRLVFDMSTSIYNPVTKLWSTYMTIDNAYIMLLMEMGVLSTVLYFVLYYALVKKLIKSRAFPLILILSILSLYGIAESSVINVYVCFPFLALLNKRVNGEEYNVL